MIDAIKYHFFALLSVVSSTLDDNDEPFFFCEYRNIRISATKAGIIFNKQTGKSHAKYELEVIVVVDCIVMITATMEVKMKGILLAVEKEEILAATNRQMPSINGMETDAATKAASELGLKSKY